MATYEELIAAARKADEAGDGASAKRFLELAVAAKEPVTQNPDGTYGEVPEGFVLNPSTGQMEDIRSPNNPNVPFVGIPQSKEVRSTSLDPQGRSIHGVDEVLSGDAKSALGAAALGAGQGLGFGSLDEISAGASSLAGGDYSYDLARMREAERRAQEYYPGAYYGSMIPGAAASSLSAGRAMGVNPTGKSMLDTMARGTGIGAGEGAIWGFNTGEGGGDRARGAVVNALIGAGIGAAAPPAIAGASWAGRKASDLIGGGLDAALGNANAKRAGRSVLEALRKSGKSSDDVAIEVARAAREGQPEYRLMDAMGIAGQRRASGISRSGGDGAEEIAQFLRQRQLDQPDRVAGFVDEAFGLGGKTAAQTKDNLTAARGAAADAAYGAARGNAAPVDVRGALSVIDDRVGLTKGGAVASDGIDGLLSKFRSRLAGERGVATEFDRVLSVKQDVQDAIGSAVRAGRNNEARELGKLSKALDAVLEEASASYRSANDQFAQASRVIGSVDDGASMIRPSQRAADTVPAFQAMTPEQQSAARIGYGDRALARIEANTSPTANVAKQFNSTKMAAETDAMAIDPALFRGRVGRENTMWETQNRALGGSRTADNLADTADIGVMADMGRAAKDAFTGRIGAAVGAVGRLAGNAATGQNEATRTLVARILMSNDPKAALATALRQETTSQGRRRIAEALMRSMGREAIPQP